LLFITLNAFFSFSQLKVDPYGRIGMGTNWPNPGYKCHIKGNMLLTTYPDLPFMELQFKVGQHANGISGIIIGATTDKIAFWSQWTSYNQLSAQQYMKLSDINFKQNITYIEDPVSKLLTLKPYKYEFKSNYFAENGDSLTRYTPEYGFISQEVQLALNDIEITEDGIDGKLLDYDQIIPLLVAGIQQQQNQISALEASIASILTKQQELISSTMNVSSLVNATPNPFSNSTTIGYNLIGELKTAEIKIWDLQGNEKKQFKIEPIVGTGEVVLESADISVSGNYVYALIVNGTVVSAKTFVFTQ
jgi:hypothetical protein